MLQFHEVPLCREAGTSARICLPETCSGLGDTTFLAAGTIISVVVHGTAGSAKTEPAEKTHLFVIPRLLSSKLLYGQSSSCSSIRTHTSELPEGKERKRADCLYLTPPQSKVFVERVILLCSALSCNERFIPCRSCIMSE